jgi:hypothetical protein
MCPKFIPSNFWSREFSNCENRGPKEGKYYLEMEMLAWKCGNHQFLVAFFCHDWLNKLGFRKI